MIDKAEIVAEFNEVFDGWGMGPLLVHSDLQYAPRLPELKLGREAFLRAHVDLLQDVAGTASLLMPAFNYQFPKNRSFNAGNDESEVGVLTEFFRTQCAQWRTGVPVFSFSGIGDRLSYRDEGVVDPFGEDSVFADVCRKDGRLLFYGAPIESATIVHYVERMAGAPLYRYDKTFSGLVISEDGTRKDVELLYHVRPSGYALNYDWERIMSDAVSEKVACSMDKAEQRYWFASAGLLSDHWISRMQEDPLYLLDKETQDWVREKLDQLGRRFQLSDFEDADND